MKNEWHVFDNDENRWHMSFATEAEAIAEAKAATRDGGACASFSVWRHVVTVDAENV